MNYLKIVTIFNWVVIALLFLLVMAETLFPTKGGGDAASGMGRAIYYLAIIALVVLVSLNLLPFNWSKYTAFILVAVPLFWVAVRSCARPPTAGADAPRGPMRAWAI